MGNFITIVDAIVIAVGIIRIGAMDVVFVVVAQSIGIAVQAGGARGHFGLNPCGSENLVEDFYFID